MSGKARSRLWASFNQGGSSDGERFGNGGNEAVRSERVGTVGKATDGRMPFKDSKILAIALGSDSTGPISSQGWRWNNDDKY